MGFHLEDHYSLSGSLQRFGNSVVLNEGSSQFIFSSRRSDYVLRSDGESNFIASNAVTPNLNPFDEEEIQAKSSVKKIVIQKAKRYGIGLYLIKFVMNPLYKDAA